MKSTRKTRVVEKSRTFIGTINRIDEFNPEGILQKDVLRIVCQFEVAPKTGKHHVQIFVLMKPDRECTRTRIQNIFGKGHWEICEDPELSEAYCMKESTRLLGPFTCPVEVLQMRRTYDVYMEGSRRANIKKILTKIGSTDVDRDCELLLKDYLDPDLGGVEDGESQ